MSPIDHNGLTNHSKLTTLLKASKRQYSCNINLVHTWFEAQVNGINILHAYGFQHGLILPLKQDTINT